MTAAGGIWTPAGWDRPARPVAVNDALWKRLREPFRPEQIGKLPRVYCGKCRDQKQSKHCDSHNLIRCDICRNRISEAHLHLDYVGHAAVTSRLLEVDPAWNWRPCMPAELELLPAPGPNGMWIVLRVLGVDRYGYGDTEGTQLAAADAVKARLSDAIKNAAMRFGVGLDIWSKEDLAGNAERDAESIDREKRGEKPATEQQQASGRDWVKEAAAITDLAALLKLGSECNDAGEFVGSVKNKLLARRRELEAEAKAKAAEPAK